MTDNNCIYCQSAAPDSKEHYLPACLGSFKNFSVLTGKICHKCNNNIGAIEEQFCKSGPEAFFRLVVGIKGRKRKEKVSSYYRGFGGAQPIQIKTKHPNRNCEIFCEMEPGTENAYPARQIIFEDDNGKCVSVLIKDYMKNPDDLKQELSNLGVKNCKPVECWTAGPEESDWIESLCSGFKHKITWDDKNPDYESSKQRYVVTLQVNAKYFRAVAKISFHYFLKHFSHFTGYEKEFDGIKSFIMNGGDQDRWVRQVKGSFIENFKSGNLVPDKFIHVLAIDKNEKFVRGFMQFFIGPKGMPSHYYEVFIGKNPEKILYPDGLGHQFIYTDDFDSEGYDGIMDPLKTVGRIILPK